MGNCGYGNEGMKNSNSGDERQIFSKDLLASVGQFMLVWSWLERGLNEEIGRLKVHLGRGEGRVRGNLQERLAEWRDLIARIEAAAYIQPAAEQLAREISDLRAHRNLIVHGLLAVDARPESGTPHIACMEGGYSYPTGEVKQYTLTHLNELAESVDRCRLAIGRLGG